MDLCSTGIRLTDKFSEGEEGRLADSVIFSVLVQRLVLLRLASEY